MGRHMLDMELRWWANIFDGATKGKIAKQAFENGRITPEFGKHVGRLAGFSFFKD